MINKALILGRVGKDPEIATIPSGKKIAKFSIATSETFKTADGEKKETTEWHNVVIWDKLAEIVEKFVKKGDLIFISGKITTRTWDDKEGKKHYSTEIIGNEMKMIGGKKDSPKNEEEKDEYKHMEHSEYKEEFRDLPF